MLSKRPKKLIVEHPWNFYIPRKTMPDLKKSFSLNIVLNLHYQQYSQAKKGVVENIRRYLKESGQDHIKFNKPVTVSFTAFKKTKGRMDKSNFYGGGAKFIYDALVELGVLVDDNDTWISTEIINDTQYDKENPRLQFIFEEK